MTCNPIILRDDLQGTTWYSVWCRACAWESEATQSQQAAAIRAKRHQEEGIQQ